MQTPKSPSGLKPVKSNLKSSAPPPPAVDRPSPTRLPPLTDQPAPPAVGQTLVSQVSNSPRGLRSISLFMPDTRTASASSNLSTEPLQQGPSSSADAPDDLAGVHARAYMAEQRRRRGTSFVDASGKRFSTNRQFCPSFGQYVHIFSSIADQRAVGQYSNGWCLRCCNLLSSAYVKTTAVLS